MAENRQVWTWRFPLSLRRHILMVVGLALAMMFGCGSEMGATLSGRVTLDGQPIPSGPQVSGNVMLYPEGGGAAAYGDVATDGTYRVTTGSTTGIAPGKYRVTVTLLEIGATPAEGGPPPQRLISPAKYQDRDNSELVIDVQPGTNYIDLALTSS